MAEGDEGKAPCGDDGRKTNQGGAASRMLSRYASWVASNAGWILPIEQAVQSALWLLPEGMLGDGGGGEVAGEALHAAAGLWSVVNEQALLLAEADEAADEDNEGEGPSRERRVVRLREGAPRALAPLAVAAVEQFETVLELVAARRFEGKDGTGGSRFAWLTAAEAAKALLRAHQLHASFADGASCMLLDGGLGGVARAVPSAAGNAAAKLAPAASAWDAFRAAHALSPPSSHGPPPAPAPHSPGHGCGSGARALALGAARAAVLGELLCTLRPVFYCALLWRHGSRSWIPWSASLLAEISALLLTQHALSPSPSPAAASEDASIRSILSLAGNGLAQEELGRRRHRLLLYLARSPMYETATRRALVGARDAVRPVPLLGAAVHGAFELADGVQGYYTYTS